MNAWVAARCLAPLARANGGECERLAKVLAAADLGVRAARDACAAWRFPTAAERDAIAKNPRLYLEAAATEVETPPPPEDDLERLTRDIEVLSGVCARVRTRIRALTAELTRPAFGRRVERDWKQCEIAFRRAGEQLAEALHARS